MQSMHVLIGRMRRLNFLLLGGGSSLLPRDVVAQQSLPVVGFLFIGNPERSAIGSAPGTRMRTFDALFQRRVPPSVTRGHPHHGVA